MRVIHAYIVPGLGREEFEIQSFDLPAACVLCSASRRLSVVVFNQRLKTRRAGFKWCDSLAIDLLLIAWLWLLKMHNAGLN